MAHRRRTNNGPGAKVPQVGLLLSYIQGDRAEATSAVHFHISRVTQGAKLANARPVSGANVVSVRWSGGVGDLRIDT
jgi:hypothetical protein